MERALYGPTGFYRHQTPRAHFRTSVHASPLLARAVHSLAERVAAELGDDLTVVDVGCGEGELLTALAAAAPATWRLVGVERRPRPAGLASRVEWTAECEYGIRGVLLAHELLDNIPVDVVVRIDGGWRQVLVDPAGVESPGAEASEDQQRWLSRWWPDPVDGDRVEVGLSRDRMWAELIARLDRGLAVAVDYAVDPPRMRSGTLTGYRGGRQVAPVPDGSCDLTAHVQLDSVAAAGGLASVRMSQRDLLGALGIDAARPPYSLAQSDPRSYLEALSRAGEVAELADPGGLGGFQWLLATRGVEPVVSSAARG